jgi:hypothetical protein
MIGRRRSCCVSCKLPLELASNKGFSKNTWTNTIYLMDVRVFSKTHYALNFLVAP